MIGEKSFKVSSPRLLFSIGEAVVKKVHLFDAARTLGEDVMKIFK